MFALALTLTLTSIPAAPAAGVHLTGEGGRSAHLIAQGPPPLPVRPDAAAPAGARELELQTEIDGINARLRELKNDWPTASVVMAYVGWSVSPVSLIGLLILALGSVVGAPAVTLVGVVLLVVGLAGVAIGIAGIVTGITASSAAKAEREDLIRRRETLERELKLLKQNPAGPAGVDRSLESSPRLFTLATF